MLVLIMLVTGIINWFNLFYTFPLRLACFFFEEKLLFYCFIKSLMVCFVCKLVDVRALQQQQSWLTAQGVGMNDLMH